MTRPTVVGATTALDVSGTPQIPFSRIVGVEMRKMVDTRAGFWLVAAIGLITVAGMVLVLVFEPDRSFEALIIAAAVPQGFLLPVLGVLLVTSEWSQRAALATFTLVPDRRRVIAAKTVAAVLLGLAAIALVLGLAAAAAGLAGGADPWQGAGAGFAARVALLQALTILQGLAFGMLVLNSAAALVLFFVVPPAFTLVVSLTEAMRNLQPWLDLSLAQGPLFGSAPLAAEQWGQLATSSLVWIVTPLALGAWRMLRAEVS